MKRSRTLLAGTALILALSGCGAEAKPAGAVATKTPTPLATRAIPVDGGTYESPLLLVDALNKAGMDCMSYSAVAQPRGAVARGSCYVGGEEWTIGIYASSSDARDQPNAMAEMLEGVSDVDMVLGRNWTIGCPSESWSKRVAAALGGEVFHEPA